MEDHLSTRELGWVLGISDSRVRRMIQDGEIEGVRLTSGFRIPRDEALRVSREVVEEKAGRKLDDAQLERLIDEVITANEQRLDEAAGSPMKPIATKRRK
jgi:excisionase family DNA binding protein